MIGFHGFHRRRHDIYTRWVVQCVCGAYDIRSRRSLRRQNMDDMCGFCWLEKEAFKTKFRAREGRDPEYFELPT